MRLVYAMAARVPGHPLAGVVLAVRERPGADDRSPTPRLGGGSPLFPLGRLLATPGALRLVAESGSNLLRFIARHAAGDWGDLDAEDRAANERALRDHERLLSSYHLSSGERIWIITEADRSATTVLLPEEY